MADEMSKVHRFMEGDKVSLTTDGNDDVEAGAEGVVSGFANEEKTHLVVDFDGDEFTFTEDELRRLA